jgi:hypothetical protein
MLREAATRDVGVELAACAPTGKEAMKKSKPSEYAKKADGSTPSRAKGTRKSSSRASRSLSSDARAPRARRLSADWKRFATRLAEHLAVLASDHLLILSLPNTYRFVQFEPKGAWGMRMETVANAHIDPEDVLPPPDEAAMRALGWQPPTLLTANDDLEQMLSDLADDESAGWFLNAPAPVDHTALALMAVRTFVQAYGVRHPSLLQYYACADDGPTILLPGLGIPAEPPPMAMDHVDLRPLIEVVEDACEAAADSDVRRDDDVFVLEVDDVPFRVTAEPAEGVVRLVCRVMPVDELGGNLFELMNRTNANYLAFGYVFVRDGDVRWATELVHEPIVAGALVASLRRGAEIVKSVLRMASDA